MAENLVKSYALDDPRRVKGGVNVLLYGVPGCGKSHEIKTKYCNDKKYMERVVFHPDYTYSDFVGQILPKQVGLQFLIPLQKGPLPQSCVKPSTIRGICTTW